MGVNGTDVKALVNSGASVSVINKSLVSEKDILKGRPVQVQGFDGSRQLYDEWIKAKVTYQVQSTEIDALVVNGYEYQFLLSRPDMKRLKINLYGIIMSALTWRPAVP